MKATGIVRRIDDLGRVVIPKEIRRTMRIREGDPLEIFTNTGGEVIFKKYSPIGELSEFALQYAEALAETTRLGVIVCDRDHCVASSGVPKKEVVERRVATVLEDIMQERKAVIFDNDQNITLLEGINRRGCAAAPIISAGDISGVVALIESDSLSTAAESDLKLIKVAAAFLGKQMEE